MKPGVGRQRAAVEIPSIKRGSGSGGHRRRVAASRAATRRPHGGHFRIFWEESQMTRGRLLFIGSKIS
jgi:hypothetical protein